MVDKRDRRVVIGDMLDITKTDLAMLENAQRRKKHHHRILSGIEALIGFFSLMGGWIIGYNAVYKDPLIVYPFSVVLMSRNIPTFLELKKKRGLLFVPIITLLIIVFGLISGYTLGSAVVSEPTAIHYNVYLQSSKPS